MSAVPDYAAFAELYTGYSRLGARRSHYERFATAAEAIRFVAERMPRHLLRGAALDVGDDRYEGEAILALYLSSAYPLERATR
ncbi:MAG: hypothetical protein IPK28_09080 [Devosia sp.]|nr:hypothetical protein [Devosia sp.]